MKRRIMELRRVLLEAEQGEIRYSAEQDASALEHARLLIDGGFLHGYRWTRDWVEAEGVTFAGHEFLDELRDEAAVADAMHFVDLKGIDPDNLAIVRAYLKRKREQLV